MSGIVSYGSYIPRFRLPLSEIDHVWQKSAMSGQKSVPAPDEDAVTLAVESAQNCLRSVSVPKQNISALLMGSESHPYAVNPSSTIVGSFLGLGLDYFASDLEFACKAGTAAVQLIAGQIDSGHIEYGLAIGSDTAQGRPHDALEYSSAAAGSAFLMGRQKVVAELEIFGSYSTDTPDFWRRDGSRFPSHAGRFTGTPAYFAHILGAARQLLNKTKLKAGDFDYCVFHMPNSRFPREIAAKIGFSPAQLAPSLIVDHIGNPYSASSLLGLNAVLDVAKPGQKIFMVSYGSGAGSDAFIWRITPQIKVLQKTQISLGINISRQLADVTNIDYPRYLRHTHQL